MNATLFLPKYTTTDVAKLGIKRERLKEWIAAKYISPSQTASGPGTKNLFSLGDLYLLKLFQYLVERGFSRREAAIRIGGIPDHVPFSANAASEEPSDGSVGALPNAWVTRQVREKIFNATYVVLYRAGSPSHTLRTGYIPDAEFKFSLFFDLDGVRGSFADALIVNFKKIRDAVDAILE